MNRPWQIWLAFALCVVVVLSVMAWMSRTALRLDCAERCARRQAALEENVRLALWRMDSALAPLIAQENARPYFSYTPFYPAQRAYNRMFAAMEPGEILVPSPLLTEVPTDVLIHFQIGPDGRISSPQAPTGNMRDLAEMGYVTHEKINDATKRLESLAAHVDRTSLLKQLPSDVTLSTAPVVVALSSKSPGQRANQFIAQQQKRSRLEEVARAKQQAEVQQQAFQAGPLVASANIKRGVIRAIWIGDVLLLVRRVSVNGQQYVQGCQLDWSQIRQRLLASVGDLLPSARLERIIADSDARPTRILTALPLRLIPGSVPADVTDGVSPIRISLGIAWACVVLAAAAVAVLLRGAVALSERRGAFVSAVTHELRTPLTTFRMYTEMLAEGMINDDRKRHEYLGTLHVEADRLGHLVENVLAYARLERNRPAHRAEQTTVGELLKRVSDRLFRRSEQSQMTLVTDAPEAVRTKTVLADVSAVEQILFNLVDNACKYAAKASDRRIHLIAEDGGRFVILKVTDHGPGLSSAERRRLFRPFCKSARDAAHTAPGVGLGLSLSRRLARQMRGDLRLEHTGAPGTCFALRLRACQT